MRHAETKNHIFNLINKGKLGQSISCRGGFGNSYSKFIFIKLKPNQITVYKASGWQSYPRPSRSFDDLSHENAYGDSPIAWVTKNSITVKPDDKGAYQWSGLWEVAAFLTIVGNSLNSLLSTINILLAPNNP